MNNQACHTSARNIAPYSRSLLQHIILQFGWEYSLWKIIIWLRLKVYALQKILGTVSLASDSKNQFV